MISTFSILNFNDKIPTVLYSVDTESTLFPDRFSQHTSLMPESSIKPVKGVNIHLSQKNPGAEQDVT
jgi:hypothetical protein